MRAYGDGVRELGAFFCEPWALDEKSLMRGEKCLFVALADEKGDDRALQVVNVSNAGWDILHGLFLERHIVNIGGDCSRLDLNDDLVSSHFNIWGNLLADFFVVLSSVSHCIGLLIELKFGWLVWLRKLRLKLELELG